MATENPHTDAQACINAGAEAVPLTSRLMERDGVPLVLLPNDHGLRVPAEWINILDGRAPAPPRHKGDTTFTDLASFIDYLDRHKDAGSVIFLDTATCVFTGILNYDLPGGANVPPISDGSYASASMEQGQRWRDWRAVYGCPVSRQWKRWMAMNEKVFSQDDFGQFIEDHDKDIANPAEEDKESAAPAKLLQVARDLRVRSTEVFERKIDPQTGEAALHWKKENDPGKTSVPRQFTLGIPVFEGGTIYRVTARLRWSVNKTSDSARALFSYSLYNIDAIKDDALSALRTQIAEATGLPLFAGKPE